MAVIATLAVIFDVDPTEMDPLFRSIDVESLDALFRGATDGDVRVTSTIAGREVTVTNDAVIANRTLDDANGTVGIGDVPST